MEQDVTRGHKTSKENLVKNNFDPAIKIDLPSDEFDIEHIDFRPVTRGLGINMSKDREMHSNFTRKIKSNHAFNTQRDSKSNLHLDPSGRSCSVKEEPLKKYPNDFNDTQIDQMNNTNHLFENVADTIKSSDYSKGNLKNHRIIKSQLNEVKTVSQLLAWLVDFFIITMGLTLSFVLLGLSSGIDYKTLISVLNPVDLILFPITFFTIYYVTYFTILDLVATPGKIILGIKLANCDEGRVSAKQTFIRSVVTILSIMIFGLPLLMDFQGKLSATKLVKDKWK